MTSWFELRADYRKVAAFSYDVGGTSYNEAKESVYDLLEKTHLDLYRDRVMQIVEVWRVQTRNEKGEPSFTLNGLKEKVVHEEWPTVPDLIPRVTIEVEPRQQVNHESTLERQRVGCRRYCHAA